MSWFDLDRTLAEMDLFRRRMEDMFEALEGRGTWDERSLGWSGFPDANLRDEGNEMILEADVPGLAPDQFEVNCTSDGLTISGERKVEAPEGYHVHRQERHSYKFSRTFSLPVKVDADGANAELHDGVLHVSLPKAAEVQPRRITVQS